MPPQIKLRAEKDLLCSGAGGSGCLNSLQGDTVRSITAGLAAVWLFAAVLQTLLWHTH